MGSPYGADCLGWEAVDWLEKQSLPDCLRLHRSRQPVELVNLALHAPRLIVLDAMLGDGPVGAVRIFEFEDLLRTRFSSNPHGLGLTDALRLAVALGARPGKLSVAALDVVKPDAAWNPDWPGFLGELVHARVLKGLTP